MILLFYLMEFSPQIEKRIDGRKLNKREQKKKNIGHDSEVMGNTE